MSLHAFVDENKQRGFLLVAALVPSADVKAARKALRALLLSNQRRIHFKHEDMARKQKILAVIRDLNVSARIYRSGSDRNARERCLRALVPDLADASVTRLIIERDDSIANLDKRVLFEETRAAETHGNLQYHLLRAHEDLLLALPDAVAWCWARGGRWRKAVAMFCTEARV